MQKLIVLKFVTLGLIGMTTGQDSILKETSVENIIRSYVADFSKDQFANQEMYFGIRIPEHGEWNV